MSSSGPRRVAILFSLAALFLLAELSFLGHVALVKKQSKFADSVNAFTREGSVAGSREDNRIASTQSILLTLIVSGLVGAGTGYRLRLRQSQTRSADRRKSSVKTLIEETPLTSEARFRTLIENSANALILLDGEGRVLYCNKASERILGRRPEELIGWRGFECVHEDDQAAVQFAFQQCVQKPGESVSVRAHVMHRDGTCRLLEGVFENLLNDPDVQAVVGTYRDITAAAAAEIGWRESEERFAKAFRSGPLAMSISTKNEGRYLDVNDSFIKMLGYERTQIIGRTSLELNLWVEPADRLKMLQQIADEKRVKELRTRLRTASGSTREVNLSAELIDLDGLHCILAITQDVTEATRLEDHLRQVQKMEALGRLAGGIAHDFNNILGVIMGYSDISMDRLDPTHPLHRNLKEIKKGSERAAALTRQLLAFTRQQVLYPTVLNLNTVVSNLNQMLQRMIGEDVALSFKPAASLGWVKLDLGQIEQILMNLVVNARDAMPTGGKITIATSNVEVNNEDLGSYFSVQPGRYVLLSVTDTGCGMDQETLSRIFEPFFTTKKVGQGTGLGLSTVYGIVKQSEGYIVVYSEMEKGTTFKLYFPRRDEEAAEFSSIGAVEEEIPKGSGTILVVEDDEALRKLTVRFLEGAGYRVLQTGSVEDAIQIVDSFTESIDLLLTDMIMPIKNGMELSAHVRMLRPNLKVLLMSGYAGDFSGGYRAIDAGVPLLEKPFTRQELLSKISAMLHE
jgi:PAS domain S-box-containing protein